jgi:hypothetical protein
MHHPSKAGPRSLQGLHKFYTKGPAPCMPFWQNATFLHCCRPACGPPARTQHMPRRPQHPAKDGADANSSWPPRGGSMATPGTRGGCTGRGCLHCVQPQSAKWTPRARLAAVPLAAAPLAAASGAAAVGRPCSHAKAHQGRVANGPPRRPCSARVVWLLPHPIEPHPCYVLC